jgi:hypothetical protein
VHGVEVAVEGQRGLHHHLAVGVVGTEQQGRLITAPQGPEPVFHTGDDGLGKPVAVVLVGIHGLTQTYQQAHIGIFLDEGGNALARIVAEQRGDGAVAVLCLDAVMVGEGFAHDDVVEHLDDKDAALVGLMGEKREHLLVLPERRRVDLHGKGILLEPDERGKGMPVPQVK